MKSMMRQIDSNWPMVNGVSEKVRARVGPATNVLHIGLQWFIVDAVWLT